MKQLKRILASLAAAVLVLSLFLFVACAPGAPEVAQAAPTPAQTASPTPTASPTAEPSPTPTPTLEPVPELTDQEVEEEIALLGAFPQDEQVPVNQVSFVLYSRTDGAGEKHYFFELAASYKRISADRTILARLWDDSYLFEFSNSYDYVDLAPQQVAIVPLFQSLQDVTVETISGIFNIDYYCGEKGIPYRRVPSPLEECLDEVSKYGITGKEASFTYREYAEFYVRALAKANRVVASDFTGPMDYVEPEQTPVMSPSPTP